MAELALLNAAWVAARGPEMGLSMGRFAPGYVAGQRIYVARQGVRPVGFATFHCLPGDGARATARRANGRLLCCAPTRRPPKAPRRR